MSQIVTKQSTLQSFDGTSTHTFSTFVLTIFDKPPISLHMEMRNVCLKSPCNGQRGFVGVVMMLAVTTLATMGLLSSSYQKRQIQQISENKLSIDFLQQNYSMYIQNDEAWKKTLNDSRNSSFACIRDGSSCSKNDQPIAVLLNPNGDVVVDTYPSKGVLADGTMCDGYHQDLESSGNKACSIHVGLTWRPVCKGACISPAVIQVNIAMNRSTSGNSAARFIASSAAGIIRKPSSMPVASQVTAGFQHTCALAEGDVYCWGDSSKKQMGPASTGLLIKTPVKVTGLPTGVSYVSAADDNTCAIQAGNVYCWGGNFNGAVGGFAALAAAPVKILDDSWVPLSNIVKVSSGLTGSCAITVDGKAYCWGKSNALVGFSDPAFPAHPDDALPVNGLAYPVQGLSRGLNGPDLGAVTDISVGSYHVCAVVVGKVYCWGNNDQRGGWRGVNNPGFAALGYDPNDAVKSHRVCYPWVMAGTPVPAMDPFIYNTSVTPGIMYGLFLQPAGGPAPIDTTMCNPKPQPTSEVALDANVKQVVVSGTSTCALLNSGTLWCWGYNYGRLARDPTDPVPSIFTTGDSADFPLEVKTITGIESVVRNGGGFAALKGGKLFAWGWNPPVNGLGDPAGGWVAPYFGSVWNPRELTGLPPNITPQNGGATDTLEHSCVVAAGKVYCWGRNSEGQLGDGTTINKSMGIPVVVTQWP